MLTSVSPYHQVAANLREQGYSVMPIAPGTKAPGKWENETWRPMPGWQRFCDQQAADFIHDKWEEWPNAGICLAHGKVIGLDLDTDRTDVAEALRNAIEIPEVRRRGQKGWMAYFLAGQGLNSLPARVRWYDPSVKDENGKPSRSPVVELLLHGTQSVLPPTIHPDTKQPYTWLTNETLEGTHFSDLPIFGGDQFAMLDAAFKSIGLTREMPREGREFARPHASAHDLEKPFGRSINDRAMEAIDAWWPLLGLPKSRQRGPGAWEGVASWRHSGSGRNLHDRNPNLRATPMGIRDFGDDRPYTPIDLVMAAMDMTFDAATDWLSGHIRPEEGTSASDMLNAIRADRKPEPRPAPQDDPSAAPVVPPKAEDGRVDAPCSARSAARFTERMTGREKPKQVPPTSVEEFRDAFPPVVPPFPVQDYEKDLTGLLREATLYIDEAANMRSEQGAFGAALASLGAIMGKKVQVEETGLRTNIYIVGTADSGAGKSSAMGAMAGMMARSGTDDRLAGSDFTSGAAILTEMSDVSGKLFPVDEFGDVVRRALAPKAASHERDIGRILKDIYSAAGGVYRGKAYATQARKDIVEPHLCLYGVSTHEAFWESLDGRSFSDGLLARFVMIPIGATEAQTPEHDRIGMVTDMITNVVSAARGGGNLSQGTAVSARLDAGIWDQWMADRQLFQRHAERASRMKIPGAPSIIQRICENGMKIAMISAMGNDPAQPVITRDDYTLGIDVAHWSAIYMLVSIERYYVENASHRDMNRVLEFIFEAGADGVTRRDLYNRFRGIFANQPTAKSIMAAMIDGDRVREWRADSADGRRGPRPVWYFASEFEEEFFVRQAEKGD